MARSACHFQARLGWVTPECAGSACIIGRMASWLIPTLKAILPHVSDVVSAVKPALTRRHAAMTPSAAARAARPEGPRAGPPAGRGHERSAGRQAAATQNADHIKEVAAQLQSTVAA